MNKDVQNFANRFGYASEKSDYGFGPTFEHDASTEGTGNSLFHLVTYVGENTIERCTGILSELPEFSFSINYGDGPGKSTQDVISKMFNNPLFDIVNAIGAPDSSFVNTMSIGKLTRLMYAGTSTADIPLKFRIYAADSLGQSPISQWKRVLATYAVPDAKNAITIQNGIKNIVAAIQSAAHIGNEFVDAINLTSKTEDIQQKDDSTPPTQKEADKAKLHYTAILNYFEKQTVEFEDKSGQQSGTTVIETVHFTYNEDDTDLMLTINITGTQKTVGAEDKEFDGWVIYLPAAKKTQTSDGTWEFIGGDGMIFNKDGEFDETVFDSKLDENKSLTDNALKNTIKTKLKNMYDEFKKTELPIINKHENQANMAEERQKLFNGFKGKLDTVKGAAANIQKIAEHRYGFWRAAGATNRNNCLGEKLWELYIYNNFLLKTSEPLTVYIKDWEIKPSKEYVGGKPVYHDVSITCSFDQSYSREQWQHVLNESLLKNYKGELN